MTTPALTIDSQETTDGEQRLITYRRGILQSDVTTYPGGHGNSMRDLRPQSVTNPIREDGTRAPSGWSHRWCSTVVPTTRAHNVRASGIYSYEYVIPQSAVMPSGNDRVCSLMRAPWARVSGGGAFPQNVESLARTRTLQKVLDSKANWGQTLGEMSSTVGGLRGWAHDTINCITAIARGVKRAKREIVKELMGIPPGKSRQRDYRRSVGKAGRQVIDRWLEYQFAFKPLLSDIDESAKALDHLINGQSIPGRMYFRAGAEETQILDSEEFGVVNAYCVPLWRRDRCHVSVAYDVEFTPGRILSQLGLTNPFSLAWELTPFSWMVDYGLGVGDWLETLTPLEGANFVEGTISRKQEVESVGRIKFLRSRTGTVITPPSLGNFPVKVGRFDRQVITSLLPSYRPAFRSRLGLVQLANSLAGLSKLIR